MSVLICNGGRILRRCRRTFATKTSVIEPWNLSSVIVDESKIVVDDKILSRPVLFIQKYERLVDPDFIKLNEGDEVAETKPKESLTQRKIKYVLATLRATSSYEKWTELMREPRQPLFNAPLKEGMRSSSTIFTDEEPILMRKSSTRDLTLEEAVESQQLQWSSTEINIRKLPSYYLMLSKSRLTLLVSITAAAGYGLAPAPMELIPFLAATFGTALMSASANSMNQILEVPFDSQMNRTKNRVLVRGILSPQHAFVFSGVTAGLGGLILANYANGIAAALGVATLILYTCAYTPMKRMTIANTWVGSVVGAIPPLIGWSACTGHLDPGSLILGGILFTWQFPHFNSLSWNLRQDYSRAGYRMMSVTNPDLCKKVALRYSFGCLAVCSAAPLLNVTDITFAIDSLPLNFYLIYLSWRFYQNADSSSSRKLFRYSLIHLPILMTLLFISKKSFKEVEKK